MKTMATNAMIATPASVTPTTTPWPESLLESDKMLDDECLEEPESDFVDGGLNRGVRFEICEVGGAGCDGLPRLLWVGGVCSFGGVSGEEDGFELGVLEFGGATVWTEGLSAGGEGGVCTWGETGGGELPEVEDSSGGGAGWSGPSGGESDLGGGGEESDGGEGSEEFASDGDEEGGEEFASDGGEGGEEPEWDGGGEFEWAGGGDFKSDGGGGDFKLDGGGGEFKSEGGGVSEFDGGGDEEDESSAGWGASADDLGEGELGLVDSDDGDAEEVDGGEDSDAAGGGESSFWEVGREGGDSSELSSEAKSDIFSFLPSFSTSAFSFPLQSLPIDCTKFYTKLPKFNK